MIMYLNYYFDLQIFFGLMAVCVFYFNLNKVKKIAFSSLVFERIENLLQNGIVNFAIISCADLIRFSRSSGIALKG